MAWRLHLRSAVAGLAALLAILAGLAWPMPASAKPLRQDGTAAVKSVDGPALLTIAVGNRTLPVHLYGADTPNPGECGAAQARAALEGFVRRAPKRLTYNLRAAQGRKLTRDSAGRLWVNLGYRVRGRHRTLSNDLARAGWARAGVPTTLDAPTPEQDSFSSAAVEPEGVGDASSSRPPTTGVAATCGGRFHLPLGEPVVPSAPAVWTISERGVTTAIGAIALSPVLTPTTTLTLGKLAEIAPVELVVWFTPCLAYLPTLQVTAFSSSKTGPCRAAEVAGFFSDGRASTTRGLKVGDPDSAVQQSFPLFEPDREAFGGFLSGPGNQQWAWQAGIDIGDDDQVESFFTYALPVRPE